MRPASHLPIRILKSALVSITILLLLAACSLAAPETSTEPVPEDATTTNTIESALSSETPAPTVENCFWNWAYGDGSTDFDTAVMEQLLADGIRGTVKSSSYGEVYSCDGSFHAKSLDVKLEIQVVDFGDQTVLIDLADKIFQILQENLPISTLSGLGNVNLTFIDSDGNTCYWDRSSSQCVE
jgi:hypothetical protein